MVFNDLKKIIKRLPAPYQEFLKTVHFERQLPTSASQAKPNSCIIDEGILSSWVSMGSDITQGSPASDAPCERERERAVAMRMAGWPLKMHRAHSFTWGFWDRNTSY